MSEPRVTVERAFRCMAMGGLTNSPVDNRVASILIRGGVPIELVISARDCHRKEVTICQRKWQSKVSRRPSRGRHHDSWEIREKYVRVGGAS